MSTVVPNCSRSALRVAFIGGGSGGHLFPAVALAQELLSENSECQFLFLTSDRTVDQQVLESSRLPPQNTRIKPYASMSSRTGVLRSVIRLRSLWNSLRVAKRELQTFHPSVVIGLGALASVPGVIAASRLKLPIALLEQNVIPGKATQVLARRAELTIFGLPVAEEFAGDWPSPCQICGTPVRPEIQKLMATPVADVAARKRILILGGSQGAHALNRIVSQVVAEGLQLPGDWEICHQTGSADVAPIREFYQRFGITAQVSAFLTNMAEELSAAGIVISRAGAGIIQELSCAGVPSILVPLSTAANNHQRFNARLLEQSGAAHVIDEQHRSSVASMRSFLNGLLSQAERRQKLGDRVRMFAVPNAAAEILHFVRTLVVENA